MSTPLRFDMTLPDGEPLRFDMPGARWEGTVEEVMAALPPPTNTNAMNQNLISQTMTDTQRDAMIADLTSFETKFANYKTNLTPDQIKHLAKLSAADIAVLDIALTYAQQNPTAISGDINVAELAKDIALAKQMVQVDAKAQQEANFTKNALITVLSDAYDAARRIYRQTQAAGRTPANMAFLDAFGARFSRGSGGAGSGTPPATPP